MFIIELYSEMIWVLHYLQLNIWQLNVQHSQNLKKRESQSTKISHILKNKFIGNSSIGRNFLKSSKVCLAFQEKWFCIRQPNLAFSSLEPIFHGPEDSI